ncbi:MAG: SurA N-terminal domain-containing protein [Novosphingobium sp.]|nr:SurA N-terminal domain-containing protein [Novosphingobium sp.]
MLQFFRNFFKSRFGMLVAIAFLGLIALAFASADVSNTGSFGGVAGGDRAATVGKEVISTSELSQGITSALENLKQENPRLSMESFLASDGMESVLDGMIARTALAEFGRQNGVIAGNRLIDSEIAQIPAFHGPDGKFSEAAYKQLIQQRGLSDAQVRQDLAQGLVARQILVPAGFGAVVPAEMARRYSALLRETRKGAVALLPSLAFGPDQPPSDAELQTFYGANKSRFIRPERRVIRYATFSDTAVRNVPAPTEAEIAARYNADKAQYEAVELRRLTQLVVPTEAAAKAIVAEAGKGTPLAAAARAKGLATSAVGPIARAELANRTSAAVADAAFTASKGTLAVPARGALGWTITHVDAIETKPGRSLEQVRGEIAAVLAEQKHRAAVADLSAHIEEQFDKGGNLSEAVADLGVKLETTPALTADGRVYGKPAETAPPVLARVIQTAFSMERENQPQVAEVEPGKTFVIFDVADIEPSAAAPLAEIRDDVLAAYVLDKGSAAARKAAEQVQAAVNKGSTLQAAMAALKKPLPPVQPVDMNRAQLTAGGQQVPPSLMLLFSMARGTVKLLPGPEKRGWFVVALDDIQTPDVKADDPVIAAAQRELAPVSAQEYAEQLRNAIRGEVGVKRNEAAIKAVARQLTGSGAN